MGHLIQGGNDGICVDYGSSKGIWFRDGMAFARKGYKVQATMRNPTKAPALAVPPSLVAAKILEVAESGDWKLRHPVGPDAIPLLQFRSKMSDEEWLEVNGWDDATFFSLLGEMN